jgi:hypothetical protein
MYTKKTWLDHFVQNPRTYTLMQNADGTFTLVPAFGTVLQQGMALNAENLNHMEQGIQDAHDDMDGFLMEYNEYQEILEGLMALMLRYDQSMTLTNEQKVIVRATIGAQLAISASGMLKAAGGVVSAAVAGTDFASPVTELAVTLAAAGWTGTAPPYSQTVSVTGMTASLKGVSVGVPATLTDAEFNAALYAVLRASAQGTGTITVKAHGEKPTVNIPILVRIVG